MLHSTVIHRCVRFPKGFEADVFAIEELVRLHPKDEAKDIFEISVAPDFRFASTADTHSYGLRVVTAANTGLEMRLGRPLEKSEFQHYIGFYSILYEKIVSQQWQLHNLGVVWTPKAGLDEHCDILISWNGKNSTKRERKSERAEIRIELAKALFGPEVHATEVNGLALYMPKRP